MEVTYSLCHDLKLDVRPCEDGVLLYDKVSRTTHLIHPAVWDFFVTLSQKNSTEIACELIDLKVDMAPDDMSRSAMLNVLERVGLVKRC